MAVLPENDRIAVWAETIRGRTGLTVTKADLRAAVDALDDFFEANAATINAAIPQPARSALTAKEKAYLIKMLLERRYIKET